MSCVTHGATQTHSRLRSPNRGIFIDRFLRFRLGRTHHTRASQRRNTLPRPNPGADHPGRLSRRDAIGIAQTGTGKTAAFALPDPAPSVHQQAPSRTQDVPRAGAEPRRANCPAKSSTASRPMVVTAPDCRADDWWRRDGETGAGAARRRRHPCCDSRSPARPRASNALRLGETRFWCSMKPTGCWTWALFMTSEDHHEAPPRRQTLLFSATMPRTIAISPIRCCATRSR